MGFIYQIRNTVNGKCYVGQTKRDDPQKRWKEHKKNNISVISQAFASHGLDKFEFSVICEIPNEELNDREVMEIAERGTIAPNGYNLKPGGEGGEMHEETKRKISEANKISHAGVKLSEEHVRRIREGQRQSPNMSRPQPEEHREHNREAKKDKMKPVDQYTLDGTFVKTWESVRATGVNGVRQCCSLRQCQAGGFVWRWHGEPFDAKPTEEQIEARKKKAREYREKNRERVNAWKRAYALKLRTETEERARGSVGLEETG
jgi:group I intron endonuclease